MLEDSQVESSQCLKEPKIDYSYPWGFFDGVCQGTPGMCGAGEIFLLNNLHYFLLKHGAVQGTNSRAKFYALWILMKTAVEKGVSKMQVLGDSKILMDWANG